MLEHDWQQPQACILHATISSTCLGNLFCNANQSDTSSISIGFIKGKRKKCYLVCAEYIIDMLIKHNASDH